MQDRTNDGFEGVIGLLRSIEDGIESYWVRWDGNVGCYVLPMGPCLKGESPVVVARREIAWTFELDPKRELVVSSIPRRHHGTTLFTSAGTPRTYTIQYFVADLYGTRGRRRVQNDPRHRLVGRGALLEGKIGGERFDPIQQAFLIDSDVLPIAES